MSNECQFRMSDLLKSIKDDWQRDTHTIKLKLNQNQIFNTQHHTKR